MTAAAPSVASATSPAAGPANRYTTAFLCSVLLEAGDLGSGFNLTDVPRASDDQQHMGVAEAPPRWWSATSGPL